MPAPTGWASAIEISSRNWRVTHNEKKAKTASPASTPAAPTTSAPSTAQKFKAACIRTAATSSPAKSGPTDTEAAFDEPADRERQPEHHRKLKCQDRRQLRHTWLRSGFCTGWTLLSGPAWRG
jgi:hypothetical protein